MKANVQMESLVEMTTQKTTLSSRITAFFITVRWKTSELLIIHPETKKRESTIMSSLLEFMIGVAAIKDSKKLLSSTFASNW